MTQLTKRKLLGVGALALTGLMLAAPEMALAVPAAPSSRALTT